MSVVPSVVLCWHYVWVDDDDDDDDDDDGCVQSMRWCTVPVSCLVERPSTIWHLASSVSSLQLYVVTMLASVS